MVLVENLGIGIDPTVTYSFYLYTQYCYTRGDKKRFIYSFHDFVQQRPVNFMNVKKFHHPRFGVVPNWHSVLYPAYPNIRYIAINLYDCTRLLEHGIEEIQIFYIPNSIDQSIVSPDDRSVELRKIIIEQERLDPEVHFILYPVRCVRRKNVEEAIFFTCLLSRSTDGFRQQTRAARFDRFRLPGFPGAGDGSYRSHEVEALFGERHVSSGRPGYYYQRSGGFGFAYLESWIADRAVIGRSIPMITPDFQAKGMKPGHLYIALIVDRQDFRDIGQDKASVDEALQERLSRILKLARPDFVDQVFARNETTMRATLRLFEKRTRNDLVTMNKEVVTDVYSQETVGGQLYKVVTSP